MRGTFRRTLGDQKYMAHGDLSVVGISAGTRPFRVAASATRYYAGEPMNSLVAQSSGAADVNTVVVLTTSKPVIGTDSFVGVAAKDAPGTGTLVAHTVPVSVPIPNITKIRGRAKTVANVDTDAELLGVLHDLVLFDLTAAVYTINDVASANTSGLEIVDGNIAKSTLDVVVDVRAIRAKIS